MPASIPNKFALKYFYIGVFTIAFFILSVISTRYSQEIALLRYIETPVVYIFLASLIVYITVELLNFSDRRRFVDYRYSYDLNGIYRENALIIDWGEVSDVVFTLETAIDVVPAHSSRTYMGRFYIRDIIIPELTRRVKVSRISFYRSSGSRKKGDLLVETTIFKPLLMSVYRKMKGLVEKTNIRVNFSYRRIFPEQREDDEESEST